MSKITKPKPITIEVLQKATTSWNGEALPSYKSEVPLNEIQQKIKESDILALMKPSKVFEVEEIPKLGTGKSDFKGSKKLVEELMEGAR